MIEISGYRIECDHVLKSGRKCMVSNQTKVIRYDDAVENFSVLGWVITKDSKTYCPRHASYHVD